MTAMRIKVEAFSTPGCNKCTQAQEILKSVVREIGTDKVVWRDVNIIEEMDYAVTLGVMSPPAIAIDGKLVFPAIPSVEKFRKELMRRLVQEG